MSLFTKNIIRQNAYLYADNRDNTFQAFNRRILFDENDLDTVTSRNLPKAKNFWENPYYGLLDTNDEPVQPKEEALSQVPASGDKVKMLINFVAAAFRDLHQHFKKARSNQRITTDNSDMIYMKADRAWKNPNRQYYLYIDNLMQQFIEQELGENKRFEDIQSFNDFRQAFYNYLHKLNRSPFLRSAYFQSIKATPFFSGLVVEVIPKKYGSHIEAAKIYGDPNYDFYAKSARKFGFVLDKNAPWRLYADLESPVMKKYMDDHGIQTTQQMFDELYHNLFDLELDNIRDLLVEYYNNYAVNSHEKGKKRFKRCSDGSYSAIDSKLEILTRDFYEQITDTEMIEVFCNIASVYGSYGRVSADKQKIIRQSRERLKHFGPKQAIRFAYRELIG